MRAPHAVVWRENIIPRSFPISQCFDNIPLKIRLQATPGLDGGQSHRNDHFRKNFVNVLTDFTFRKTHFIGKESINYGEAVFLKLDPV